MAHMVLSETSILGSSNMVEVSKSPLSPIQVLRILWATLKSKENGKNLGLRVEGLGCLVHYICIYMPHGGKSNGQERKNAWNLGLYRGCGCMMYLGGFGECRLAGAGLRCARAHLATCWTLFLSEHLRNLSARESQRFSQGWVVQRFERDVTINRI